MARIRGIRQHDRTDCGAACLCSIARAYGLHLPLSRIRELASTDRRGTNVAGLLEAAEKMGFMAKGIKGPIQALKMAPLPSIAHIRKENNLHHFVVLTGIAKRHVKIMDPEEGSIRKVRLEELQKQWTGVLVMLAPGPLFTGKKEDPGTVARFFRMVRSFRNTLIQALLGAVLYSLLGLSTSLFVQKIMDFVLLDGNLNLLNLMGTAMIVLLLIRILISWFKSLYLLKTGHQIDAGLLMGYYRHLLSLPQRFFDTMRTGEILSRMNDAIKIRIFINHSLIEMIVGVLTLFLTLLAMVLLSLKLCLLTAAFLLLYLLIYYAYDTLNRKVLRNLMENTAGLESQLVESVQMQRTIRGFEWKTWATDRTAGKLTGVLKTSYKAGIASILSANAVEFLSGLLTILMLWSGSVSVVEGEMSPGELMSFYTLLGYLLSPVKNLGNMSRTLRDALIAADRLFHILDLEQEKNARSGIPVTRFTENIEFCRIGFRYGSRPELFKELTFTLPLGKLSGIVGKSGSGKSSIAAMLTAEYMPFRGSLTINNCDIRQIDRRSLRRIIGIVPQHIEFHSGSILENLVPENTQPDLDKLIECASKTGLLKFLRNLPDGFNTQVGEMGKDLSGGEKQRIAITRALYHDPQLLILDEATAALDPVSESDILRLIEDLRSSSMTLILISHKLNQVMKADHIVMIESGRAAETGRHEDLIKSDGPYRELWRAQNRGT